MQLLSQSSSEPWLRLLCYDTAKAAKLVEVAQSGAFEPHPISGEVEVDWDYDAEIRYRRLDEETLQALVVVEMLGLAFQLIYCVGDTAGGGDGWRIGEVTIADKPSPFLHFEGVSSIAEADRQHQERLSRKKTPQVNAPAPPSSNADRYGDEEEDEDDGYWDRYDATPARTPAGRTPAAKRSPAPASLPGARGPASQDASNEDDYFAQYDDVQPAMDNHDPDEEAQMAHIMPPLGVSAQEVKTNGHGEADETHSSWTMAEADTASSPRDELLRAEMHHPRPESSASSNGEQMVAKLEVMADKRGENEFSVKQHVSRTIRSLWMLSRGSGIDREDFENMVKTELDVLGMVEDMD